MNMEWIIFISKSIWIKMKFTFSHNKLIILLKNVFDMVCWTFFTLEFNNYDKYIAIENSFTLSHSE